MTGKYKEKNLEPLTEERTEGESTKTHLPFHLRSLEVENQFRCEPSREGGGEEEEGR